MKEILDKEIFDKIKIVSGAVTAIGIVVGYLTGFRDGKVESYLFFIIAFIFLIIFMVSHILGQRKPKDSIHLPKNESFRKIQYEKDCKAKNNGRENGGKCLLLRRTILTYKNSSRTLIGHRKEFDVTALVNGVSDFYDRYRYSGEGECILTAPEKGQDIKIQNTEGLWTRYSINLSEPMRENSTKRFVMEMKTIRDPNKTTKPFLSSGIYEPTKRLEIVLKFLPGMQLIEPKIKIFLSYDAATESEEILPSQDPENFICDYSKGLITYSLNYPIYGHRYQLVWDFIDQ